MHSGGDIVEHRRVFGERARLDVVDEADRLAIEVRVRVVLDHGLAGDVPWRQRSVWVVGPLRAAKDVCDVEVVVQTPDAVRSRRFERVSGDQFPDQLVVRVEDEQHIGAGKLAGPQAQHVDGPDDRQERQLVARPVVQSCGRPETVAQVVVQLDEGTVVLAGEHFLPQVRQVRVQFLMPVPTGQVTVSSGSRQRRCLIHELREPLEQRHKPVDERYP